jgi:hypothetical protein
MGSECRVNPQEVLFSLPTLNDALPGLSNLMPDENTVMMHEDHWRQFEFVEHRRHLAQSERELWFIDCFSIDPHQEAYSATNIEQFFDV